MKDTKMADKYISTAKVIDGILILSLPDAVSPVVWQMELGQSKSSALEIRDGGNGQFILTLKTPRQDVLDIATYANRDLAIKALLVTTAALEKGQGQLKAAPAGLANGYPVPVVTQNKTGALCILKKILMWLAGIAAGLILLLIVGWLLLGVINVIMTPKLASTATSSSSSSGPVSADEFLENR
jgi:hypothetical protein